MDQNTCPECGYIHPPCAPGACPVATGMREQAEAEAKGVGEQYEMLNDVKNELINKFRGSPLEKIRSFIDRLIAIIRKEQI